MNRYVAGGVAGFLATVPMTVVMVALHRRLPPGEQQPLPPHTITMELAEEAGVADEIAPPGRQLAATMAGHFGYGAATGALYAATEDKIDAPAVGKGIAWGLAVWAVSYLGWLPATGLFPPATDETPRRNALMIAAHVVWGAATGALTRRLARE